MLLKLLLLGVVNSLSSHKLIVLLLLLIGLSSHPNARLRLQRLLKLSQHLLLLLLLLFLQRLRQCKVLLLLSLLQTSQVLTVVRRRGVQLGKVDGRLCARRYGRRVRHQRKVDHQTGVKEAQGRK